MTNAIEIKVNDLLLDDDGEQREIASIVGRWVKLTDGANISRAQAAEWREMHLAEIDEDEIDEDEIDEEEIDEEEIDEDEEEGKMSETLRKYREAYVPTVSHNGNSSLDNGDEVAALLRGLSPNETCAVADVMFDVAPGYHRERWQSLNEGSRRMNAGNRIRALVRRGEKTTADLEAAIKLAGFGSIDDAGV